MLYLKDWYNFLFIHILKRKVVLTFFSNCFALYTPVWLIIGSVFPCFPEYLENNFPQNYQRLSWVLLDNFIFHLSEGLKLDKMVNRNSTHPAKTLEVRQTPRETPFSPLLLWEVLLKTHSKYVSEITYTHKTS